MTVKFMSAPVVGLLVVLALGLLLPSGPSAAGPAPSSPCGWRDEISVDARNVLFIDEAASYWSAAVPVPDGGSVQLTGAFPRARYLSIAVYDQRGRTVDHLADHQIEPDAGSVNPARTEADREASNRSYTLRVVHGRVPEDRPPNTLYTESADGTRSTGGVALLTLRTYLPDDPDDSTGGAGLPEIVAVAADGERTSHPSCLAETRTDGVFGDGIQIPAGQGSDPPRWERFLPDGLGENVDNSYVYETYLPSAGPVLTLQAAAPTVGRTLDAGGELRYWSLCSNTLSTAVHDCVADEEVPVVDGDWTIVVSPADQRPTNARAECGVAWLEAPPGDAVLVYRHMLPAPGFTAAIQHVDPGREVEQMGAHYPVGVYESVEQHERRGCTEVAAADDGSEQAADDPGSGDGPDMISPWWVAAIAVVGGALVAGVAAFRRRHRPPDAT